MRTALVTGASAGLGAQFVRTLAGEADHIVLVARDEERMTSLADELAGTVTCEVMVADLSTEEGRNRVAHRCAQDDIDLVVNNAGFGIGARFSESDWHDEQRLIDVLVTSLTQNTHAAIPGMIARGHGYIINVSSLLGWVPVGTYGAAKAFVTSFSESQNSLLKNTGVKVTVVSPGFIATEFQQRAAISTDDIPDFLWLDPEQVVNSALRDVKRGKAISVPSLLYRTTALLVQYLPRPIIRAVATGKKFSI